jgi:hypothetical protein
MTKARNRPGAGVPDSQHPSTANLVTGLDHQIEILENAKMPEFARTATRDALVGLRALLAELVERDTELSGIAIQEVARAYLVGRRDAGGLLGGTTRRELWPRLVEAGIDF